MHPASKFIAILALIALSAWLGFLIGRGQVVPAVVVEAPPPAPLPNLAASSEPEREITAAARLIERISILIDEPDPQRYAAERVDILAGLEQGLASEDAALFGPAVRYFNELISRDSVGLLLEARSLAQSEQWFAVIEQLHAAAEFPESNEQLDEIRELRATALANIEGQFETAGDWHGLEMYAQKLSDRNPHSDRLRLLIARAQIELGEKEAAQATLDNTGVQDVDATEIEQLSQRLVPDVAPAPVFEREGEALVANAEINGVGLSLLVDTGASVTALSADLLSQLNAQPLNQTTNVQTAAGTIQAEFYEVPELIVQNRSFENHRVLALDNAELQWDGLLGMDIIPILDRNFSGDEASELP